MNRSVYDRRHRPPLHCAGAAALSVFLSFAVPSATVVIRPSVALAQTPPQVTVQLSEDEVEVGEPFTVQLKAMSEDGQVATSPELRAPAGFSVSGPMISTQTYMQFGTGGRRMLQGIGATWTLVASAPGKFTIPAATVSWNGQRVSATPLSVKVAPQGTLPRRQQGGSLFPGGSPFSGSPFGSNWPFGAMDDPDDFHDEPSLTLPRAPSNDIFLHARADKKKVVVGEQVTVSVYRYYRPRSISDLGETKRMHLRDFLQYSLLPDGSPAVHYTARAGDASFHVRLLEKIAIFPLKTGSLATGTYNETYTAYNRRTKIKRGSEDITVQVVEPPLANRPPGYRLGDVGQFQITSLVQPRRVEEGGSVAVTVKITGSGNLPTKLPMPEKTGVEWLDPEKKEGLDFKGDVVSGFRSFGHVVRLAKAGTIDLGTIELPYWNPRAQRYETATSKLGTIEVTPAKTTAPAPSAAPSAAPEKEDPFANLPPPRTALSSYSVPAESTFLTGPRFAFAVALPPVLALAGIAGAELVKRGRARLRSQRSSPRTLAASALDEAKKAKAAGDGRAVAAAVERAVVLAIEGASGVRARGVLKEELASELVACGITQAVAERSARLLAECDRARFDPLAAAADLVSEGESLVRDLFRQGAR